MDRVTLCPMEGVKGGEQTAEWVLDFFLVGGASHRGETVGTAGLVWILDRNAGGVGKPGEVKVRVKSCTLSGGVIQVERYYRVHEGYYGKSPGGVKRVLYFSKQKNAGRCLILGEGGGREDGDAPTPLKKTK